MVDWAMASRRGSSELAIPAALGHGGSPVMVQWGERSTGSPSRASPGRGRWRGDQATAVKKQWRRWLVWVALGHVEKRRRTGRRVMENSEAGEVLTRAPEMVRWPGDDGKAAVAEELDGSGTRARRGDEESWDGCCEGRVRASAFYKGWRQVGRQGLNGQHQCRPLKTPVTQSEKGGRDLRSS
jgi:hypothetical protein